MFRTIFTILLTLAISGCVSLHVPDEDLDKTKRIGVISILGETFHGISIGTTVFNNTFFSATVPEWGINKYAASTVVALLRENARFESGEMDHAGLDWEIADESRQRWEAAEKQGFDKLIIIRPRIFLGNYSFFKPSFGLFERSMFGLGFRCVYMGYRIGVYDVATGKQIAAGGDGEDESCNKFGRDNQFTFKKSFKDYTPEEKQAMRQRLEAKISKSLRHLLEQLQLVPATTK
jgi:hypothetical protein